MTNPTAVPPLTPADVPATLLSRLARDYDRHVDAQPDRVNTLGVLTAGTVLLARIEADRWSTALAALTEGATLDEVADAMGMDPGDVRIGLIMGRVSDTRLEEIVSLVDGGDDTVSEPGPQ